MYQYNSGALISYHEDLVSQQLPTVSLRNHQSSPLPSYTTSLAQPRSPGFPYQYSYDSYNSYPISSYNTSYNYDNYAARAPSPESSSSFNSTGMQQPISPSSSSFVNSSYAFLNHSAHNSILNESGYSSAIASNSSASSYASPLLQSYSSYQANQHTINQMPRNSSTQQPWIPGGVEGFNQAFAETCAQVTTLHSTSVSPSSNPLTKEPLATSKSKSKSTNKTAAVSRRPTALPDAAVDILNTWFDEHINNPYPLQHEKEALAQRCNLTVKQISAWFSNRRNRMQYTKPKRIQRMLVSEISGLINQEEGATKHQLIEKICNKLNLREFSN